MKTIWKRSLAVLLALFMAFGTFSFAGSARMNATTTAPECWDGAGTITYGLGVYKVEGSEYTKLASGVTLHPNDVVEVRVSFGTDFYTAALSTVIYYDKNIFVPFQNDKQVTTTIEEPFKSGFFREYRTEVPVVTLDSGATGTFYDTLSASAGLSGGVNRYEESNIQTNYYPLYMKDGGKKTNPILPEYQNLGMLYSMFQVGSDSATDGESVHVPYATYFSFQMQVAADADTNGETTSIFLPILAQKTTSKASGNCNKLYAITSSQAAWIGASRTQWGQGLDLTNGEFEAVISAHSHTWDTGVVQKAATCSTKGEMLYTCIECGETMTEEIDLDPDNHLWGEGVVTTEPTCTAQGVMTYTCDRCGAKRTRAVDALDHDFGAWIVTKAPTVTEEGEATSVCSRCQTQSVQSIGKLSSESGTIALSSEYAHPGETFTMTVSVLNNPGIVSTMMLIDYDPQILTLIGIEDNGLLGTGTFEAGHDLTQVPYTFFWLDSLTPVNYTASGAVVTLTFRVADDAPEGATPVTVTYALDSTFDVDMEDVVFGLQNGGVTISERCPGDANRDGKLNLKDVARVQRYVVGGWDVTIDASNADVDGSGTVTLADVVLLKRYLVGGWYVELL